uniref:Uncharacterized protein n=1 Tax=Brassica oleracea TaxID=3712 RepID=A0A3P6H194_BRAOL|nr:unnamed protein product [Brassica oleracea]
MGLTVTSPVSESLLLLPPPPEPPPSALPLDLLGGIPAPTLLILLTLPTCSVNQICPCSVCLLLVPLRVKLVRHLLLPTAGCRSWIYDFVWGNDFSMFLSLFSKGMIFAIQFRHLVCLTLPQYEVLLPQYEVVVQNLSLPSIQYFCMLVVFSDVSGILLLRKIGDGFKKPTLALYFQTCLFRSVVVLATPHPFMVEDLLTIPRLIKRCMITFVAKLLAAFYAFVQAACWVAAHRVWLLIPWRHLTD